MRSSTQKSARLAKRRCVPQNGRSFRGEDQVNEGSNAHGGEEEKRSRRVKDNSRSNAYI